MSTGSPKAKTALSWLAVLWLILLAAQSGHKSFSPARIRLYWSQAVAGPYDYSDRLAAMTVRARGCVVAVLWIACAAGWGRLLGGFMRLPSGAFALTAGWCLGLTALGLAVFGLGVEGLLHPACLLALCIPPAGLLRKGNLGLAPLKSLVGGGGVVLALIAATGVFLCAYLFPASAPELGWDALTYHLRAPSHYLAARRIYVLPFSLGSFYPFLAEMWVLLAQAFGGDDAAKLFNYAFLPATVLALAAIGAEAGSLAAGWLAALLYTAMPAAGVLAGQCYNDLEVALLGLVAVWAALKPGRRWALASAVLCGASLGCKYSAASVAIVCGTVWAIRTPGSLRRIARLVSLAVVALIVFAVWPLRDWLWTGNPAYPLLRGLFPETGWNPYFSASQAASIVPVSTPRDPFATLLDLLKFPADFSVSLGALSAIFTPLIVGFLPALLLFRGMTAGTRGLLWTGTGGLFLAGVGSAAVWVVSRAGDGRYLLPTAALLSLPAATGALRLAVLSPPLNIIPALAVAAGLVIQGGYWLGFVSQLYVPWRVAVGLEARSTYLSRAMLPNHEYMPMAGKVNAVVPARTRVLMFSDIVSYYIDREVVFDTQQVTPPIAFRLAGTCRAPAALRKRFRQLGLEYVLYSSRIGALERDCKCLSLPADAEKCYERFWRRYAEQVVECGSMRLMRLRTESEAARLKPAPFLIWPGIQDAAFIAVEDARNAGDWKRAAAVLNRLLARVPDLAEARFKLAEVYLLAGRTSDAMREAEKARKSGLDSGSWWLLRGGVLHASGDYRGAAEAVRQGTARWPSPRAYALLASYAYQAGDLEGARRAAAEAMRLNPYDAAVKRAWSAVR